MFDFPSSPTIGQVSNGYTYTGVGWAGGPGIAGPQTEQFFDVSGKTAQDIAVPTWAKACTIIGYIYVPASTVVACRVSADGTTFFSGALEYQQGGPVHNSGSAGYVTNAQTGQAYAVVTATGDNASGAHNFTLDMNVARPSTNQVFVQRSYSKVIDSNAANVFRSYHNFVYLQTTATTALALKAIRLYLSSGGAMGAGSTLYVQWQGDSAAIPQSNAIADAPNDAYQYLRGQNVWNSGGTLSGDLTISKAEATFIANKLTAASNNAGFLMQTAGKSRWIMAAAGDAESGANAGSSLYISNYNDAGTYLGSPIIINRATGVVTATGLPPKPQAVAGAGQWTHVQGTAGAAVSLPAGGTWAWFLTGFQSANGALGTAPYASVAAGGTVMAGASAGIVYYALCWRIA